MIVVILLRAFLYKLEIAHFFFRTMPPAGKKKAAKRRAKASCPICLGQLKLNQAVHLHRGNVSPRLLCKARGIGWG